MRPERRGPSFEQSGRLLRPQSPSRSSINEIMLDDLALFVRIVEGGSLSAADQTLAIPAATLTRRLQKLEYLLDFAAQEPLLNGALS